MKSTICVAEDRASCEPCLKVLLLSLQRHCSGWRVDLFYPVADEKFRLWLRRCPQVQLHTDELQGGCGWNIKPRAAMHLLDKGFDEVIWIDSDIVVTENILDSISNLAPDTVVATDHTLAEERDDSDARRARLWGLPVGRSLPTALNSGVVRVTRQHYGLMQDWWELLQSGVYQEFQKKKWSERPVHMLGDQDVLTALLTSRKYAALPLHVLKRGKHILQFDGIWGYTVPERARNLLGNGPAFVHSAAGKPWSEKWPRTFSGFKDRVKWVYLDVSPYTLWAMQYRAEMECDMGWARPHFFLSRLLRIAGLGRPALTGAPMAAIADLVRLAKWIRHLGQSRSAFVEAGASGSALEK
jgi:hypothetical protein